MILFDNRMVSPFKRKNVKEITFEIFGFWSLLAVIAVGKVAGFYLLDPQIVLMQTKYNNYSIAS